MRERVFPGCKMAASTVYKHRVLGVAILHLGNTHALIGQMRGQGWGKRIARRLRIDDRSSVPFSIWLRL